MYISHTSLKDREFQGSLKEIIKVKVLVEYSLKFP
jgi:hypothetical protein